MAAGYDIVLDAGQSNEVGRGGGGFAYPAPADDRILQLGRWGADDGQLIPVGSGDALQHWTVGTGIGNAVTFARLYAHHILAPDRQLVIVPVAQGSTHILFWLAGGAGRADYLDRTHAVLAMPGDNRVVAMKWQQGEQDVQERTRGPVYLKRSAALFSTVRENFGSELGIYIGRMAPGWRSTDPIKKEIEAAQACYVNSDPKAFLISSAGLLGNDTDTDSIHFNADSQTRIGGRWFQRFFQQWFAASFT